MDILVKVTFAVEMLLVLEIIVSCIVSFSVHSWRKCNAAKKIRLVKRLNIMTKIDIISLLIFGVIMGITNYRIMVLRNANANLFVSSTISDNIWFVLIPCVSLVYSKRTLQHKILDSISDNQ